MMTQKMIPMMIKVGKNDNYYEEEEGVDEDEEEEGGEVDEWR